MRITTFYITIICFWSILSGFGLCEIKYLLIRYLQVQKERKKIAAEKAELEEKLKELGGYFE